MAYELVDNIPVWGRPDEGAVRQMQTCARTAAHTALMADHHLGYAMPIGGVIAYEDEVSPSGVGYDIACGNKAVLLDADAADIKKRIAPIMDDIQRQISFGIGRSNKEEVEADLFDDDPAWHIGIAASLKDMARKQLGTVGSGNHYVDLFTDEQDRIWCGVHFGSRGLGHKLATHFIRAGGGKDGMMVEPVRLRADSDLGREYIACMKLAGRYAYAGRDWVCQKVAAILGAEIKDSVHNHHNFAWRERHGERDLWVVRKGATPCFSEQRSFVGGSMGDISVIIRGRESDEASASLYSTVHGAGRVMSRTQAAGKRRWKKGKSAVKSAGLISREMMLQWIAEFNDVELRGAGTDESPHVYKRLPEVLNYHADSFVIEQMLMPIGVAMAVADEFDPFRD
jgi:tRNA-splicing ligase RtcB (3'-phosphate/5'-hydroxy nucleic acid ligase)